MEYDIFFISYINSVYTYLIRQLYDSSNWCFPFGNLHEIYLIDLLLPRSFQSVGHEQLDKLSSSNG